MPQTMKALVKREAAKGIWMEQVPLPEIGPNDVLVKLEKTAICGTDLHIYKWDEWSQRVIKPGLVIGHEFVGRIVDMGPGVRGYTIGQRVSAEGHIVCGVCRNCRAGKQHLCPYTIGIGVNRNGAFAEYISMPSSNLWPIPDQIPSELAAFFDPYGNAAHCALEFDLIGEDVLITGAGPIGIIAAGIAKHVGARNVVVTDVNDYRLKLAADMGATRVVNVYSVRLPEEIIFDAEFRALCAANPNFKHFVTCTRVPPENTSWTGLRGRINAELVRRFTEDAARTVYYSCGSHEFVASLSRMLLEIGLPKQRVIWEDWG